MNDVRDLEEEVSEGLTGMKENLDEATMDMSSKYSPFGSLVV